jgi:molecular chaperone GrpE
VSEQTSNAEQVQEGVTGEVVENGDTLAGKNLDEATPEELRQMLEETRKRATESDEGWKRARADFLNLKRRTEQERGSLSAEAREKLIMKFLGVVDDFELALKHMPENLKEDSWVNGVVQIEKKLKKLLDSEMVSEIPALDQEFNPHLHYGVQRDDEGEGDKEVVTDVYQKGYKMGDKVIRPAMVKVGRK